MEADYKQQREALLARLARAEQSYKENLERAVKMKAKADALEKECEQKDRYIAELTAKVERIKRELGIQDGECAASRRSESPESVCVFP